MLHWVLIESDWNLKTRTNTSTRRNLLGINRIRLEFKAKYVYISDNRLTGINRIRLEFKEKGVLHSKNL